MNPDIFKTAYRGGSKGRVQLKRVADTLRSATPRTLLITAGLVSIFLVGVCQPLAGTGEVVYRHFEFIT